MQTCEKCYWFVIVADKRGQTPACYADNKWRKWLKKKLIDKPNDCSKFKLKEAADA